MQFLEKTMEDVRKHKDIKLVATDARVNYWVSEQNYDTAKCFSVNLLAMRTKTTQILMNNPAYLGLSIL